MRNFRTLATAAVASLVAAPLFIVAPAHATTIDVSGQTLNFGNDIDEYILQNGGIEDSYLYENVVTVDGVQVDAVVTIEELSENSLGDYAHEYLSEADIVELNGIDENHVDVAGCYSNEDYVIAYENGDAYDFLGFLEAGSLKGGDEVEYIDGFEDDESREHSINTGMWLCDPEETDEADGFVEISVAFEVDGSPVTLENVAINAIDIDNSQRVTFFNPAPTSFVTSGDDSLVTIEDNTDASDSVTFIGPVDGDEDGFEDRYVGEVQYDSVSVFSYTFELVDSYGGSLEVEFASYFDPEGDLASTGVDATSAGYVGVAAFGLGVALVVARRGRRATV